MKRGGFLKRKTPLRSHSKLETRTPMRRTWMKRKSARRVDRETPTEKAYKKFVHGPSATCDLLVSVPGHECNGIGQLQQAHLRDMTGLGLKEKNLESIPACPGGHDQIDGRAPSAFFGAMSKAEKKAWMRARIAIWNARFVDSGEAA